MARATTKLLAAVASLLTACDSGGGGGGGSPPPGTPPDGGVAIDAPPGTPPDAPPGTPPDGGTPGHPDAGDGCATPPTGDWTGTTRIYQEGSGSFVELTATATWTLARTESCVDHYTATGTAHQAAAALCNVLYEPADWPIMPTDGELVIDRSVAPATYTMLATTEWDTLETCGGAPEPAHIGGTWVDAFGSFEGRVIAGTVDVDFALPRILTWRFTAVGASFPPPGAECAEPSSATWMYTGSITGEASAEVMWTRTSSAGCVDQYTPTGTARIVPYTAPACVTLTWTPDSGPVEADDGTLTIDRSTNPPSFQVSGATSWFGTITCTHDDGTVDSFDGELGGHWSSFQGEYEGRSFSGGTRLYSDRYDWSFSR